MHAMSAWYVFGLSVMDGYHSVILALAFSGSGNPDTRIFWADQIYSGWDDVTGSLDTRITSLTQRWWDPLPANRKARTRVTLWPLLPGNTLVATTQSRATRSEVRRILPGRFLRQAVPPPRPRHRGRSGRELEARP